MNLGKLLNTADAKGWSGISTDILDNLGVLELENLEDRNLKISGLQVFSNMCDLIRDLGWFEHTSDWDPFLEIKLIEGEDIETEGGYYDSKFMGADSDGDPRHLKLDDFIQNDCFIFTHLSILDEDEDGEEAWRLIEIDNIKSIELRRY